MGYTTIFKIKCSSNEKKIIEYIKNTFEIEQFECLKWYDYRENILEVSDKFPNVLITVYGQGEECDLSELNEGNIDLWVQYFKNGKCTPTHDAYIKINFANIHAN